MNELGVGKEVVSYCTKCKLNLAHIIVTMKPDNKNIGKVECKTCKATHAFKDPSQVKASSTKSTTRKKRASTKESISDIWMKALNESTAKSRDYSIKEKFEQGDIVDHPKFGPGIVEKLIDADKIQIIFRHEIKTLIHNK